MKIPFATSPMKIVVEVRAAEITSENPSNFFSKVMEVPSLLTLYNRTDFFTPPTTTNLAVISSYVGYTFFPSNQFTINLWSGP